MIKINTKLLIIDNSKTGIGKCIRILNNKKYAKVGDKIVASITFYEKTSPKASGQTGETGKDNEMIKKKKTLVSKALVVTTTYPLRRKTGVSIKYPYNGIILLDDNNIPQGTKIDKVSIPFEIADPKIRTMAQFII